MSINFTEGIKKRLRRDWDAVIVITGDPGVGKTTLMVKVGKAIDDEFDIIKNVSYIPSPEDIKTKFNNLKRYQVLGIDEAMEVFYKQDFMKEFQKELIKMYGRERKQNKATIICIPNFADLTKYFRNSRVKYWLYIIERGHGVLLFKPQSPFSDDAWGLKRLDKAFMELLFKRKAINMSSEDILGILKKTPFFVEEFWFNDMGESEKKMYLEQGVAERDRYYREEEQKGTELRSISEFRKRAIPILKHEYSMKEADIGHVLSVTPRYVYQVLKQEAAIN